MGPESMNQTSATDKPFQRKGGLSNAAVGAAFEEQVQVFFASFGIGLTPSIPVPLGFSSQKNHAYDLGCVDQRILVECKSHTWTATHKVPSAKMTTWDQAMLYFHATPGNYRMILCVLRDYCEHRKETLADYYIRTHGHLIPPGVEIWELDSTSGHGKQKPT